jgi:hypothetical protein
MRTKFRTSNLAFRFKIEDIMKAEKPPEQLERFRDTEPGPFQSTSEYGWNGRFFLCRGLSIFCCIVSDGVGWEHVSVSKVNSADVPSWEDMCWVKRQFWGPEEAVIQIHPKESEYVNYHKGCLHMWRSTDKEQPLPPASTVGPVLKSANQGG